MSPTVEAEAWHFLALDGLMRSGAPDGTKPETGRTYRLPESAGAPLVCRRGFSACRLAIHAVSGHAAGPLAVRLRLSGQIIELPGDDKLVASEMTVLAGPTDALQTIQAVCAWALACVEEAHASARLAEEAQVAAERARRDPKWWAVRAIRAAHAAALLSAQTVVAATLATPGTPDWHAAWTAERARQNDALEPRLCALLGIARNAPDDTTGTPSAA